MKKWSKFISVMLAIAIAFSGIAMPKLEVEAGVTDITNPERLMLGDAWTL